MDNFIAADLIKYVISDYVSYPYIIYCNCLEINKRRKCTLRIKNTVNSENISTASKYVDDKLISKISKYEYGRIYSLIHMGKITIEKTCKYNRISEIWKYLNGFLHGWCIDNTYIRFETTIYKKYYLNGILNGPFVIKSGYGDIYKYTYKNGVIDGPYEYYKYDWLQEKGYKYKNFYIGTLEILDYKGKVEKICNYNTNGRTDGFQYYYDNGFLSKIEYHKDGFIIDDIKSNNPIHMEFNEFIKKHKCDNK
jgi:hypothetical protein